MWKDTIDWNEDYDTATDQITQALTYYINQYGLDFLITTAAGNGYKDTNNPLDAYYNSYLTHITDPLIKDRIVVVGNAKLAKDTVWIAPSSNCGSRVDLIAPGTAIYSTTYNTWNLFNHSGYGNLSGTSMAAPHVAAVAAVMWSVKPSLSGADIKALLIETASVSYGYENASDYPDRYPLLDAYEAVARAKQWIPANAINWLSAYIGFLESVANDHLLQTYDGFSLLDMDGDGTPELLFSVGNTCHADNATDVYYYDAGAVKYAGDIGGAVHADDPISASSKNNYPGVFLFDGGTGYYETIYNTIRQGEVIEELVSTEEFVDIWGENVVETRVTKDDGLFLASESTQLHIETYDSLSAFLQMLKQWLSRIAVDAASVQSDVSDAFVSFPKTFYYGDENHMTELLVFADGTFEGHYLAWIIDGDEFWCDFSGEFSSVEKISEYEYAMKLTALEIEGSLGETEIITDQYGRVYNRIVTAPPKFEIGDAFHLYLPGYKTEDLPRQYILSVGFYGMLSWYYDSRAVMQGDKAENAPELLPFYGLYNTTKDGFALVSEEGLPESWQ